MSIIKRIRNKFKKESPSLKIQKSDISSPSRFRVIGGSSGLSPSVRFLKHPQLGNIITSKYDIVRFYQDELAVCYNAALAMYMCSTRHAGLYHEMDYHDKGRKHNLNFDYKKIILESVLTRQKPKWEDLKINKLFGSGLQLTNATENNLTTKTCMLNSSLCPDANDNNAFLKYVQTFERILSHGPVIACSDVTRGVFPHYFTNGLSGVHERHAYLIYGIVKYIHQGILDALFVCVDPNFPNCDTFISVLDLMQTPWATIMSNDTTQMRPNSEVLPIKIQDYTVLATRHMSGIQSGKQYKFYRYMHGPNPRNIKNMLRNGFDTRTIF